MNRRILSGVLIAAACAAGAAVIVGVTARSWAAPPSGTATGVAVPATPPAAAPSSIFPGGELGELLSVYVPREPRELQRLLQDARETQRATGEIDGARRLAMDADGRVRILRGELQTTRTRRDVARRTGDLAKQTEAEATYRRQTREVAYLEKLRDTMREDAERASAEHDAATARVKSLEQELQLATMRADLLRPAASLTAISRYRDQLWQVLEAQRVAADRSRDASGRLSRVAELRMRQVYSLSQIGR
jgi:hypothetical protein